MNRPRGRLNLSPFGTDMKYICDFFAFQPGDAQPWGWRYSPKTFFDWLTFVPYGHQRGSLEIELRECIKGRMLKPAKRFEKNVALIKSIYDASPDIRF
jgi:hypothetical protein